MHTESLVRLQRTNTELVMDKSKKKGLFISLRRLNSQKDKEPPSPGPRSAGPGSSGPLGSPKTPHAPPVVTRVMNTAGDGKSKRLSNGGIMDIVQCPLCLEVLHNPKMLPCQHTYCLACITVYVNNKTVIDCPTCRTRIHITSSTYLDKLPSNLYIDSLLQIIKDNKLENSQSNENEGFTSSDLPSSNGRISQNGMQSVELFAGGVRCSHCKTICDNLDVTSCEHCKLSFCGVCWSQHLDDMQAQIGSILKQLDSASTRLEHKIENYSDRCDHLTEQINLSADEKIGEIIDSKDKLLVEATNMRKSAEMTALALKTSLDEAKSVAARSMVAAGTKDTDKVSQFMNLHQNALHLLSDVSRWDTERFVFDKENFCIETDAATPLEAESDDPLPEGAKQNNPLENEDTLTMHYRSKNFLPHYVWRKTSRPCGVGVGPWDGLLYVCAMDVHSVLVVERAQARTLRRLTADDVLCPVHVAFMKSLGEIYVTDKWKHCVHVFSKEGAYLRALGQKGSRPGHFRSPEGVATDNATNLLYVVDTGNDRVQVIQPDGKVVDQLGVATKQQSANTSSVWQSKEVTCTELNAPTSVAITNDRVIILDSGNRRVKVYNKSDKTKILEFGSLGQRKGQFRQPEVLTVDPMGFILVGDSGNSRVQVFKPNGQLVRVFGGLGAEPGKFGWISGIHVTKQLDIIISDTKNHSVNFL